ncbi:MAG: HEPN domain-containing protein/predicted nucleotidyltransferase [Granulosicoccus sp.]|jgi:HEPN domain-containing protein/predicted nucleotidyltransferase
MKTTLPKESKSHQEIIEQIAQAIKDVGKQKISHIILFGSFARGTWQNELKEESDGRLLDYVSDYDLLVITKQHNAGTGSNAVNLENKINEKIEKRGLGKKHPASIIIEPLTTVNTNLKKGQYFFSDIKKEGILLYKDDDAKDLKEAKELSDLEKKEIAQKYFDYWIERAEGFFKGVNFYLKEKDYRLAAFNLHQTAECLYQCTHLVFTNYSPKLHDLEKLEKPLVYFSKKFLSVFPKNTLHERENFDLLKRAYVEARYNENYSITKEQLEYLTDKVEGLDKVVKDVCLGKIGA